MSNGNKNKCPVCESTEYESIEVCGGGEYPPYIYAYNRGSVSLLCCKKCGVVRLAPDSLERIKNK